MRCLRRSGCRGEGIIKMAIIGYGLRLWAVVRTVMNITDRINCGESFTGSIIMNLDYEVCCVGLLSIGMYLISQPYRWYVSCSQRWLNFTIWIIKQPQPLTSQHVPCVVYHVPCIAPAVYLFINILPELLLTGTSKRRIPIVSAVRANKTAESNWYSTV